MAGVGTGGTICGTGKFLKEKNPNIRIWGIDTYGSVFKKYKETGIFDKNEIYPYITEGIGEDFLPKNVDFNIIDRFEKVTDKDAAIMTREITKQEGIFAGNSAGSAMAGLIQLKNELKPLNPGSKIRINQNIEIEFINTTHSTLQTVMVAVHTPEGVVMYANDFKLDNSPVLGQPPDYKRLGSLQGKVKTLIVESLYAHEKRKTPSEAVAREMLKEVMLGVNSRGKEPRCASPIPSRRNSTKLPLHLQMRPRRARRTFCRPSSLLLGLSTFSV